MRDRVKQFFVDARFILTEAVITKLFIYISLGAGQVLIRDEWSWPEVMVAGLLAWKTFMSNPNESKKPS